MPLAYQVYVIDYYDNSFIEYNMQDKEIVFMSMDKMPLNLYTLYYTLVYQLENRKCVSSDKRLLDWIKQNIAITKASVEEIKDKIIALLTDNVILWKNYTWIKNLAFCAKQIDQLRWAVPCYENSIEGPDWFAKATPKSEELKYKLINWILGELENEIKLNK